MSESNISHPESLKSRWLSLRTRLQKFMPFSSGVLAALLALLIYNLLIPSSKQLTIRDVNDRVVQVLASATAPSPFSTRVYQVIQPSLVLIQAHFPGQDGKQEDGLGSGVVITDVGDILTSLHVVDGASEIQVIFADGTETAAQVVFAQPEKDIAVLSVYRPPLLIVPATLGNPNSMQVGDEAFVVGNPFGLYSSMSSGVISGFNRSFQPADSDQRLEGMIQIDAAVNPGNSGGPLLNRDGYVIGIVTGIVNPTEENFFVGIGFAVPIDVAVSGFGSPPY